MPVNWEKPVNLQEKQNEVNQNEVNQNEVNQNEVNQNEVNSNEVNSKIKIKRTCCDLKSSPTWEGAMHQ